jgi:RimJ/RimL family protein N-acetyltransferase
MSARRLSTPRLDLVTATAQHVLVALEDVNKLGRLLGADLPPGWPPPRHDEASLRATLGQLHRGPAQIGWWTRYAVLRRGPEDRPVVIGVVALHGRPADGAVELAASLVPEYRGRGLATEALRALVDWAFDDEAVATVHAYTPAEPLVGERAAARVLEKLGFVEAEPSPRPDSLRWAKTRAAWAAEGPVARRVPKLATPPADAAIAGIPGVARTIFDKLYAEPLLDDATMRAQIRGHVARIEAAAKDNPYVDDILARDIARVCEGLLDAVVESTPEWIRRQIQAASRYFVTEEDGDSDLEIGGLDEDAAVANAIARHLGRGDLVSDLL